MRRMKKRAGKKVWDREAVINSWISEVLNDGRKAPQVTLHWRKRNLDLPEDAYVDWVRLFRQRLHSGGRTADRGAAAGPWQDWPEWLAQRLQAAWGERAAGIASRLTEEAPLFVRANTLRCSPADLQTRLAAESIGARALNHACLRLEPAGRSRIFRSAAYREGLCEVQDEHSQEIALLLDAKPGESVIDACAGEGGKTLQLAALMANRGRLRAFDPNTLKLEQLRRRARRAGCHNIEARETPTGPTARRLRASADAVLIDAPCSGTGVIRRHPEIKWRLTAEQLEELTRLQAEILARCASWAKPGGRVVYATCSLLPEEGEAIIAAFLDQSAGAYEKVSERRWWPEQRGGDAFYAALLRRIS